MKIIRINSTEEAIQKATNEIEGDNPRVCLTGGNFGGVLLDAWIEKDLDISSWEVFLTDERITLSKREQNSTVLYDKLSRLTAFDKSRFNTFQQASELDDVISEITAKLSSENILNFDISFLSLGEDGHLAGHFQNSNSLSDTRFCYTDKASKKPRGRISFNMDWLMLSTKVILVVLGKEKEIALSELISGKGIHSNIWDFKNLVLITNIPLEVT